MLSLVNEPLYDVTAAIFHHHAVLSFPFDETRLFLAMSLGRSKPALLIVLIFSQFAGTSLWFAGNAVVDTLPGISPNNYAILTSIVQAGFIAGTLIFSLFTVADRFSPARVFFISSVIAAIANSSILVIGKDLTSILVLRFITGFFLAGIYPVGMKIAADLFPQSLGRALGLLVGALVLGTAFPHFVRSQGSGLSPAAVFTSTSLLALLGGTLIFVFVPPTHKQSLGQPVRFSTAFRSFASKPFRSAAFGYFGHMWELYAFWSLLPLIFQLYNKTTNGVLSIYFWSFIIIAAGSLGCAGGGLLSQKWGSKKLAFYALLLSGICCLLAPVLLQLPEAVFLFALVVWGVSITADSPQFSALVAQAAEQETKGTALTLVTSLGFAITIISIQLMKELFAQFGANVLPVLGIGPLLGLLALKRPG